MKHCLYLLIAAMAVRGQVPSDSVIRAILADFAKLAKVSS
jgi:hypothetical protein